MAKKFSKPLPNTVQGDGYPTKRAVADTVLKKGDKIGIFVKIN